MNDKALLLTAAIIGGTFLLLGFVIWLAMRYEKKRTLQLMEAAKVLGFESLSVFPPDLDGVRGGFVLMNTGRNRTASNIVRRQADQLDVVIYDYRYTVGHGKSAQTPHQTVVMFHSPKLQTPRFILKPEGWLNKIGELFGGQDIDFDEAPEFSKKYVLAGDNESAIREFFTPERLELLNTFHKLCVQAQPETLLFWFDRKRTPPGELQQFFEQAFSVYSAFKTRE
jgi:hypothetical protein